MESCKASADKDKRKCDDDEPDPDPTTKKLKTSSGSGVHIAEPTGTTTSSPPQPNPESGPTATEHHSEHIHEENVEFQTQEDQPKSPPPSPPKSKPFKSKPSSSKKSSQKPAVVTWLDDDEDVNGNEWFDQLASAQIQDDEASKVEDSTFEFTHKIKHTLNVKKMTKRELRRIKNDAFILLKDKSANAAELEYHLENIARAMSSEFDWTNPDILRVGGHDNKNRQYITDWTKPLPVIRKPHGTSEIPFQFFFNKDLELLMHGASSKMKYATSITFTPAASYQNPAIEEAAIHQKIFIKQQVIYDRDAELGIHHWYDKRKNWYKYKLSQKSREQVTSDLRIMAVISVSGSKKYDYTFLSAITVRRHDNQIYSFSEADFPDLSLNDIEDLYLIKLQGKLQHLSTDLQYAFSAAICHFIRRTIIKERVEDLQLGVESYQQKLNLVEPIMFLENNRDAQYTMKKYPVFGFVYRSATHTIHFMSFHEIHKFCDDTLKNVRDGLVLRVRDHELKKSTRWTHNELKQVMQFILKIERRLYRRDQIRRLESYVGGCPPFPIRLYQRTNPEFTKFNKGG